MLVSLKWLQNYVKFQETPDQVFARLVQAGVEVAEVRNPGSSTTKVVIADLLEVAKHPQADRLSLTKVSDGKNTYSVVCGAKNIAPGQKVPLALLGATLPGGVEIKPAKIRGVESQGMLCSARELGLAEDAEGILILPPEAPTGGDFLSYMGLPDTLFEVEITPNRPDLLSHYGLAREIACLTGLPPAFPQSPSLKEDGGPVAALAKVEILAKDLCPLYTCRVVEGVKVGPSPQWLRQALEKLGQRSINNIVDVTNYVLLELGQPLHAFDHSQVRGSRITLRKAKAGEKLPLLDGTERELKDSMLVIADAERAIALAGVMGGGNSQVTDQTQAILLESALFLPGSVRKTARALGLSTASSYRFERGVDPAGVKKALDRAAALIQETAGGHVAKGQVEVSTGSWKAAEVKFRPARANALLGLDLGPDKQADILKRLGCETLSSGETLQLRVPSYRLDLTREVDLIEEIARVNGYDRIPLSHPSIPVSAGREDRAPRLREALRQAFQRAGLDEAVNSTFLPPDFAQKLRLPADHPFQKSWSLSNPTAEDQKVLRPSLLFQLLANVQLNLAHQQPGASLYELGKVFLNTNPKAPEERTQAAAVLAGQAPGAGWANPAREADFFDLKGLAEGLLGALGLKAGSWEFDRGLAPYQGIRHFRVFGSSGEILLAGGAVDPKVLKAFDIAVPCFALELDLPAILKEPDPAPVFTSLPKFPSAFRDVALVAPDRVTALEINLAIQKEGGEALQAVLLFDHYRGPHVPQGHRSLAYRLQFQAPERTLTDEEVNQAVQHLLAKLKEKYAIGLR